MGQKEDKNFSIIFVFLAQKIHSSLHSKCTLDNGFRVTKHQSVDFAMSLVFTEKKKGSALIIRMIKLHEGCNTIKQRTCKISVTNLLSWKGVGGFYYY